MKKGVYFCGFVSGICLALCIYLPMHIIKGRHTQASVHSPSGTVLALSQTHMTVVELQSFAFLCDSKLSGDIDEVRVSSDGRLLCIGICMRADGPNVERQFLFSDLVLKEVEKDGTLIFTHKVPIQTASR